MLYKRYFKRPLDIILSATVLIVLSPVMLIVAILVRIKLGSPVIFRQERPGLNEKIFTICKFRTMTNKRDANGLLLPDGNRLTKFGKTLRSTSLDELPEFFNVLKGDMSLIGPRPLLVSYLPYYKDSEKARSKVRPGITGFAQISGRNILNWADRFIMDVEYINKISFRLDIYILFKTIYDVCRKKNILMGTDHILKDLDKDRKEMLLSGVIEKRV